MVARACALGQHSPIPVMVWVRQPGSHAQNLHKRFEMAQQRMSDQAEAFRCHKQAALLLHGVLCLQVLFGKYFTSQAAHERHCSYLALGTGPDSNKTMADAPHASIVASTIVRLPSRLSHELQRLTQEADCKRTCSSAQHAAAHSAGNLHRTSPICPHGGLQATPAGAHSPQLTKLGAPGPGSGTLVYYSAITTTASHL